MVGFGFGFVAVAGAPIDPPIASIPRVVVVVVALRFDCVATDRNKQFQDINRNEMKETDVVNEK